jgi:glycosyltransferase involved in cell wall biosynthesis
MEPFSCRKGERHMSRSVVSIVIPAYNEEQTIGEVIEETIAVLDSIHLPYEIIVVDDGSTDKTREVAFRHKAIVLHRDDNRGKGNAIRKGLQFAQGYIIDTIDSDGSHRAKEIPDLIRPLHSGADIVAGSRFLGRNRQFTSEINKVGNQMMNTTIKILTGREVTDSQTGFRAFKREFLNHVTLESDGFDIESEITIKGLRNGFKFEEIPITCEPRLYDISKVRRLSDGLKIMKTIIRSSFAKIKH